VGGLEEQIQSINGELAEQITNTGYVPFAAPAVEKTAKMLREKRVKGEK
jgi:DNA sulfur modification protein DndD